MTTPLAGIADAAETPNSPTAAEVAAAKAIILSVIASSYSQSWSKPGGRPKQPNRPWMFDALTISTAGVNAALGHEGFADILTEIMRKLKELRSQF
jgi:hypothetical protein